MQSFLLSLVLVIFASSCASLDGSDAEEAELHLRMGSSLMDNQSYPQALSELLRAEELNPSQPVIQNNLGLVYFAREKLDLAEKHMHQAIKLDPKFTDAKNNLGRILIEQKKYSEAEQVLTEALQDLTFVGVEKLHLNLGLLAFRQKKYTQAKASLIKAVELQRQNCLAQTLYGRCLYELGDFKGAAGNLDRAVGFCQGDRLDEPQYYSALSYYQIGEQSKAEVRLEEIVKLYSSGQYYDRARKMLETIRK